MTVLAIFQLLSRLFNIVKTNKSYAFDNQPANAIYCESNLTNSTVLVKNTLFLENIISNHPRVYISLEYDDPFAAGLTVVVHCPRIRVHLDNITAEGNAGRGGGNLAFLFNASGLSNATLVVLNNSVIRNGVAVEGGGIFVLVTQPFISSRQHKLNYSEILLIENTCFESNSASYVGGAISIVQKESTTPLLIGEIVIDSCQFFHNSLHGEGVHGGTAITSTNYLLTEIDQHISPQFKTNISSCFFYGNYVTHKHMTRSAGTAVIFVKTNPYVRLHDINITSSNSSGILGLHSNLILSGTIVVSHNQAESGGGILLCESAILITPGGVI